MREVRRAVAIGCQGQYAHAGLQMRTDKVERASVQRYLPGFRQGPAKPGSREAERGWRRHRQHLGRIDLTCQDSADAVDERVTRSEHADWPAAALRPRLRRDRMATAT